MRGSLLVMALSPCAPAILVSSRDAATSINWHRRKTILDDDGRDCIELDFMIFSRVVEYVLPGKLHQGCGRVLVVESRSSKALMRAISARWSESTSAANRKTSGSWPEPVVPRSVATIASAPW